MLTNMTKQTHYSHTCGGCYGIFRVIPNHGGGEKKLQEQPFKSEDYSVSFIRFDHKGQPLKRKESKSTHDIWFCGPCLHKVHYRMAELSLAACKELPEEVEEFEIEIEGIDCVFKREKIEKAVEEELAEDA